MKISLNWLRQYVPVEGNADALAEKLTMAGIEVEAIVRGATIPEGVVVGEIRERRPHPDADKLSVCQVFDGRETLTVVCGAPNCDVGVKAPFATLGTTLIDPESGKALKIKKRPVRGVESNGMICAADELGLGGDHRGILELPPETPVGVPVASLFPADTVFELEITPNRPDCLSHWGVAREIAAVTGSVAALPEIRLPEFTPGKPTEGLIEVLAPDLCPRYIARVIRGVRIAESPEWLKERLRAIGARPINNVVDITNFVLHELGHPLHAFDLDELAGKRIVVRRAAEGEKILTLDGTELTLDPRRLVIADAEKPVALAGVMGGEHSGVTEKTVNILLESAYFNPANIRETSRVTRVSSDSSYRFERGADFEMAVTASERATALILELAGGELASEMVDAKGEAPKRAPIACDFAHVRALLGLETLPAETIVAIFRGLALGVSELTEKSCVVTPPSWRGDLEREADLIEEVARVHGLDNIPAAEVRAVSGGPAADDAYYREEKARNALIALGLYECVNYTLTDGAALRKLPETRPETLLNVKNPISAEQDTMRPDLLGGLLQTVAFNVSRGNHDLRLFEMDHVFYAGDAFPEQRSQCCVALTGRRHPERFSDNQAEPKNENALVYDFADMKGLLESWLEALGVHNTVCLPTEHPAFAVAAELRVDDRPIAVFGQIAAERVKSFRLRNPLFAAIAEVDRLLERPDAPPKYAPLSPFPSVARDVALVVNEDVPMEDLSRVILANGKALLEDVTLSDIYRDDKVLGAGRKSLKFTLTFRRNDRTLTDTEVNAAHEKIRAALAKEPNTELR